MKMICAVRDRAIDAYGQPIFCFSQGEALRSFMDEVNRENTPMNKHPEDYDLYLLGAYDELTGELIPEMPKMLLAGKEAYRNPQANL